MWWFYLCTVRDDFKQALLIGLFLLNRKKEMLFPFTKRAANKRLKIIVQFLYFRFAVKYFNNLFLTKCLAVSNSSLKISLVSNPVVSVLTNYYQLPTNFSNFISFDNGLEVRSVFLDISKAFDEVWNEGRLFKLKQSSISGELLHILFDSLSNKKQRVVLKDSLKAYFLLTSYVFLDYDF